MPPKCRFSKEEIVRAALEIAQKDGIEAVTARSVGAFLGSSSKVIFGPFASMEELLFEVRKAAYALYEQYLQKSVQSGKYPPYKASGMGYIRFAKEQKELFRLLFMRDRSGEEIPDGFDEVRPIIRLIQKNTGLSQENAEMLHLEMWLYVHGIATMVATSYLNWDEALVDRVLTDGYLSLKRRYCEQEEQDGSDSDETS